MANAGSQKDAAGVEALFVKNFCDFEFIVTPSGVKFPVPDPVYS